MSRTRETSTRAARTCSFIRGNDPGTTADHGHAEVADRFAKDPREYSISTKEFVAGPDDRIAGVNTVRVAWEKDALGQWKMTEVPDSQEFFKADLVLLALGFLGPEDAAIKALGLEQDARSNIRTPQGKYLTGVEGVFAAGDCRRGQSLIVHGINEGRSCAAEVDRFLVGDTRLPNAGSIKVRSFAPAVKHKSCQKANKPSVEVEAVAA